MKSPPPPGAALLEQYLRRTESSVYAFAKRTGIPCDHVLKVVRGKRRRICVDLALDIQAGTDGEVPVESWRMREPPVPLKDTRPIPRSNGRLTGGQAA
jgi:plasmid maintenance system antidote protein VapI